MTFIRTFLAGVAAGAMLTAAPLTAKAQDFINVLTGGTSGVYYPLGVALAKIYGDNIAGVQTQVQSTKASVENLNLLQQGKGEIALALGDSVKLAAEGNADAGFKAPLDKLRGIAAVYPNYIQIVATKESGIKTLADLKGKSLSVGAPKSGTELNARAIFAAAGMSYDDLGKTEYLPFAELVELIKNRQLDATLQSAGLGVASLKDLSTSLDVVIVVGPGRCGRETRRALHRGNDPGRHLRGPDRGCGHHRGGELPRHPFRRVRRYRLPDDQAPLRQPSRTGRGAQGGGGDHARGRVVGDADPAASGRGEVLQGNGHVRRPGRGNRAPADPRRPGRHACRPGRDDAGRGEGCG